MSRVKANQIRWVVAVVLILLLATQAILSLRQKSVTVDEMMYIAAGYYHLRTSDFQMNMTNPPLMKLVSALPLLTLDLELPSIEEDPVGWNLIEQWKYARAFLYHNRVDADTILHLARLPIVLLSIVLGLYVFAWSRELYGATAGLLVLFLYSFSPNILAHSRLATQDLGLTAFMFISTYYFWRYVRRPSAKTLTLSGIFFGLALLTKTTAYLLIPIFALYGLICILKNNRLGINENLPLIGRISEPRTRLRQGTSVVVSLLVIGILGLVVLNIGYGFQGTFQSFGKDAHARIYEKLPVQNAVTSRLLDLLVDVPIPLPSPYVEGLRFQYGLAGSSGGVYFAGNIYENGLWYLQLVSFLLKTPIPTLILLVASTAYMIVQRRELEAEWLMATFVAVVLFFFSYLANVNVGLRYVLPIYPFVLVLIGRLFAQEFTHHKVARILGLALLAWYLWSSIRIYPHYLAYFNEFIGGPKNGYKYLVDSNLDWGQDLEGLKHYMEEKGIEKIKLGYFGSADAAYYGINYDYLPSVGLAPTEPGQYWWYEIDSEEKAQLAPQKGTIAVSATLLANPGWMGPLFGDAYEWLKQYEPVDQVGYSILVYEID